MKLAFVALLSLLIFASSAHANYATVSTCHAGAASTAGAAITTSAVDCTGADLIVLTISCNNSAGGTCPPSDSSSNTWSTAKSQMQGSAGVGCDSTLTMYYVQNPTVSSSQTFTSPASGGNTYSSIQVQGFTGSTTTPLDVTNSASGGGTPATTRQPGSITPGQNGELVMANLIWCPANSSGGSTVSVNGGFTITNQNSYNPSNAEGGALSYIIQTTAAAVNPTWTISTSSDSAAAIASFKPASYTPPPAVDLRSRRGFGQ